MYAPGDDWNEFLLIDDNFCSKYANRRRRWMHQLRESRTDGEYFTLCRIPTVFPGKFREYYVMNIETYDYILDRLKDDLRGYSNFGKCIEAERYAVV